MSKRPTPEYKEYVIKLVVEEGKKATQLAYELGIGESSIRRWVKEYRDQKAAETEGIQYVTPTELKRMQNDYEKKLCALEEENAILKKAMHIFAKNQP
ncbi:transposase [Solibacillus sp. FSL R7-0668]|uniref:transposase n=1 Tax=Solibacillus sp. FSL R7-0668 TaxID=2921688 RepID=UPI0030F6B7EF